MKDPANLIVAAVFALLGAFLGLLVFTFALGGLDYVFLGKSRSFWRGGFGLSLCLLFGGLAGWVSYHFRDRELGPGSVPYEGTGGGYLFAKRMVVLIVAAIACYHLWDLARGLR